jgi:hypothetical protein
MYLSHVKPIDKYNLSPYFANDFLDSLTYIRIIEFMFDTFRCELFQNLMLLINHNFTEFYSSQYLLLSLIYSLKTYSLLKYLKESHHLS